MEFMDLQHFYFRWGATIGYRDTVMLDWYFGHSSPPSHEQIIAQRQLIAAEQLGHEWGFVDAKAANTRRRNLRQVMKKQLGSLEYRARILAEDISNGIPEGDSLATAPIFCHLICGLRQSGVRRKTSG